MQGRAFLERGIRNNPDDWSLLASLGFLLSDSNKFPAFRDPNACLRRRRRGLSEIRRHRQGARLCAPRVAATRSPGWKAGKAKPSHSPARLYAASPNNRTPTLMMLLLVLEAHENPALDVARRAIELFGTPEKAYDALSGHWQRTRERFPVFGVSAALDALEKSLAIPSGQKHPQQTAAAAADPGRLVSQMKSTGLRLDSSGPMRQTPCHIPLFFHADRSFR